LGNQGDTPDAPRPEQEITRTGRKVELGPKTRHEQSCVLPVREDGQASKTMVVHSL